MADCIFCRIAAGEIPSNKLYEDDQLLAFYDLDPQAPSHFLVIPKAHIASVAECAAHHSALVAHTYRGSARLAAELGLEQGCRVVTNCGPQGGQTVPHLQFHVLAGRDMTWPPG